jgi:hypothetical protein
MRAILRIVAAALLAGTAVMQSGCALLVVGAAAGAATGVIYHEGELQAEVEGAPPAVIKATERAFRDLIWTKDSAGATETDGKATARTATGKPVAVKVEMKSESTSEVGIRIGTFGDEAMSRMLHEKIVFFLENG